MLQSELERRILGGVPEAVAPNPASSMVVDGCGGTPCTCQKYLVLISLDTGEEPAVWNPGTGPHRVRTQTRQQGGEQARSSRAKRADQSPGK